MADAARIAILAMGPNDWHKSRAGRQQLLSRLAARGHPVIYTTGYWHVWDWRSSQRRAAPMKGRFDESEGVLVDTPPAWRLRSPRRKNWDRFVVHGAVRRWRDRLREFGELPQAAVIFHPRFGAYARHLEDVPFVYHAFDQFRGLPGWTSAMEEEEQWLIDHAYVPFGVSRNVKQALEQMYGRRIELLENGVDYASFSTGPKEPEPPDLQAIGRPRIGYVGRINRKIDLALIDRLAAVMQDCSFVLVGPVHDMDEAGGEHLGRLSVKQNVHLLGEKTPQELPRYMSGMDVNIMPYDLVRAPWMASAYPLKLHEYLATGRPVVSAPLNALNEFRDVIGIADSTESWEERIRSSIHEDPADGLRSKRAKIAEENDWERRVDVLEESLLDACT